MRPSTPGSSRPRSGRRTAITSALVLSTVLGGVALTGVSAGAAGNTSCALNSSFGRMFPQLAPASWSLADLTALANRTMEDVHVEGTPLGPGQGTPDEMKDFPAGYNYTGQFIDHDITLDDRPNDLLSPIALSSLVNARTPNLELDSVYANGPSGSPGIYEADGLHFKLGAPLKGAESDHRARDLVRGANGQAILGDPRNDENQIVASLHSIFTRYHNVVVDSLKKQNPTWSSAQLFAEARKQVTYSYQWAILTDFLPKVAGADIVSSVVSRSATGWTTNLQYYNSCNGSMPIEFSGAAYRFGHSLVRNDYEINELHDNLPVFTADFNPNRSLVGFQPTPQDHAIDWKYFFNLKSSTTPQDAYQFDNSLVPALKLLPGPAAGTQSTVLATRNILRGQQVGLPSGQDVARAMGVVPLRDDQILIGPALGAINSSTTQAITSISPAFAGKAPLWTYILAEAAFYNHQGQVANGKITTNSRRNPERLGPVGGRIVAETLVGLLKADPTSVLNNPSWAPSPKYQGEAGAFRFRDIVKIATGLSYDSLYPSAQGDGYTNVGNTLTVLGLTLPTYSTVWVRNNTVTPVKFGGVSFSGPNAGAFSLWSNGCIFSTSPGLWCGITVRFSGAGASYATMTVDTDGLAPARIDLKGNANMAVYQPVN